MDEVEIITDESERISRRTKFEHIAVKPDTFLSFKGLKIHQRETDDQCLGRIIKEITEQMQ